MTSTKTSRNDPCPCGSGRKYKRCCQARDEASAAAPAAPESPRSGAIRTALDHHRAGRLHEAETIYRQVLQLEPAHPDALHYLGMIAHQVGRAGIAVELIGKAISVDPDNPACYNNLGNALKDCGRIEEAVAAFDKALALDPHLAETHNNLGLALQQLGRVDAAAERYAQALALRPDYPEAHNNLGLARLESGATDAAIRHFRMALAIRADLAPAHNNLGNAYLAQGALDLAIASYRAALQVEPAFALAHFNLGNALRERGELEAAIASYETALAFNPDYVEAHNNLGLVRQAQGRLEAAIESYAKALAARPDYAEAHGNLGTALMDQGRLGAAVACLQSALSIKPDYAEAHCNLGHALHDRGENAAAIASYHAALAIRPDYAGACAGLASALLSSGSAAMAFEYGKRALRLGETDACKALLFRCLKNVDSLPDDAETRDLLIRAITEPWGRPGELAPACRSLVAARPMLGGCIRRAATAWPARLSADELFGEAGRAALGEDRLWLRWLENAPVCDLAVEHFLTLARQLMLDAAPAAHDDAALLAFDCALARQCCINEYVFFQGADEFERALALRAKLAAAIESGAEFPASWLAAVAAYVPLAELPLVDTLLAKPWPEPVAALLARELGDSRREKQNRRDIPALTGVDDSVSRAVREQYEQNPYPRWVRAAPAAKAVTVDAFLRHEFPWASFQPAGITDRVDILVAGCGTGQHALETARRFRGARVLAVDLSLASLRYADWKTREIGVDNIEYAHGDIMALAALGRTFDVIESVGVLHHLRDPLAGWRILLALLRPAGLMRIGLYSELARRDIVAARQFIAGRGYGPDAADIRRCRQELMAGENQPRFARLASFSDFFSTSECRDLLFHVQEHRFTLPQLKAALAGFGLDFVGFFLDAQVIGRYRRRFPDDTTLTDLDAWHAFETENPETFAGMYQFVVQKRA